MARRYVRHRAGAGVREQRSQGRGESNRSSLVGAKRIAPSAGDVSGFHLSCWGGSFHSPIGQADALSSVRVPTVSADESGLSLAGGRLGSIAGVYRCGVRWSAECCGVVCLSTEIGSCTLVVHIIASFRQCHVHDGKSSAQLDEWSVTRPGTNLSDLRRPA